MCRIFLWYPVLEWDMHGWQILRSRRYSRCSGSIRKLKTDCDCGLGVNDLTSIRSYLNKYRRWPESSKLYLLSVNPTKSGAPVRCNNQRIEAFNNRIKKVENATYIDCYRYLTNLGFGTKGDGLHYDAPTNWAIYSIY